MEPCSSPPPLSSSSDSLSNKVPDDPKPEVATLITRNIPKTKRVRMLLFMIRRKSKTWRTVNKHPFPFPKRSLNSPADQMETNGKRSA